MNIYFIRHGETDWNKVRKLQGQIDIPLNEFGRQLAVETAPALKDISFDIVFTSPLGRAKETMEIVLGGRDVKVVEDERIMEMGFGIYEGYYCKGENFNIPDPEFHYFYDAPEKYKAPQNGEDFFMISARLEQFLQQVLSDKELQDKTILISTHGAALCGLLRLIKKRPMREYWGNGVHKNCAVTYVEVKDGCAEVKWENKIFYNAEVENW